MKVLQRIGHALDGEYKVVEIPDAAIRQLENANEEVERCKARTQVEREKWDNGKA